MEMHQVRYFLAVSRVLNFTRAADECHVAQPSLTRAIKKLEEELGGDLFRRERSRTHLTELGRLMQPHLQQCYDSAVAAKALAQSLNKGKIAPLRLALSHTIGMRQLTPALNELMRACPGLSLKFYRGAGEEVAEHMKIGDSEIAVAGPLADDWERFEKWPLFDEAFTLVAHKDRALARRNEVDLKDLAGETIFSRPYCEQGRQLATILEGAEIDNWDAHRVVSEHDLLELLQAGMGVAILPESFAVANNLRAIRLRGVDLRRTVFAYSVFGRQRSPAGNLLLKLLRGADWSAVSLGTVSAPAA